MGWKTLCVPAQQQPLSQRDGSNSILQWIFSGATFGSHVVLFWGCCDSLGTQEAIEHRTTDS